MAPPALAPARGEAFEPLAIGGGGVSMLTLGCPGNMPGPAVGRLGTVAIVALDIVDDLGEDVTGSAGTVSGLHAAVQIRTTLENQRCVCLMSLPPRFLRGAAYTELTTGIA
jgi:hypothetical protein